MPITIDGEIYNHDAPAIKLKHMYAFRAECSVCEGGIIMMMRDQSPPHELRPKQCWCIQCGQRYYLEIDDIGKWESEQWMQKSIGRDREPTLKESLYIALGLAVDLVRHAFIEVFNIVLRRKK